PAALLWGRPWWQWLLVLIVALGLIALAAWLLRDCRDLPFGGQRAADASTAADGAKGGGPDGSRDGSHDGSDGSAGDAGALAKASGDASADGAAAHDA